MAPHFKAVRDRILLQRVGGLNFLKQDWWDRAPENRGMWAFPWPYSESYLNYHQLERHMPKKHRSSRKSPSKGGFGSALPVENSSLKSAEEIGLFLPTFESAEEADAYWAAEEAAWAKDEAEEKEWLRKNARKVAPLRKFWWSGRLYAHFNAKGEVLALDKWSLLTVEEFAKALMKNRGNRVLRPRSESEAKYWSPKQSYSQDHLEVFLSPKQGKMVG